MSDQSVARLDGTKPKLKIGLIVDSEFVSKYVYDLAKWGQAQNDLVISHVVIKKSGNSPQAQLGNVIGPSEEKGSPTSLRRASFSSLIKFENFRLRGDKHHRDHLQSFNLKALLPESVTIAPVLSKTRAADQFSMGDIEKVRALDLDVLIQCGSGTLGGEILESSRYGVIAFRYSDVRINRGGPPGFWEVYFQQDDTGFILEQLTDTPDRGNILIRGRFPTRGYFLLNQAALYSKSNFHLKKLLHDIANAGALPAAVDSQPYFNPVLGLPTLRQQIIYLSQVGTKILSNTIGRKLQKKDYRWALAYARSDWKTLDMPRAVKIKNPPNHFLADPFVIREGVRDYCFAEDLDYKTNRGFICAYELKEDGAVRLGDVIVEPFHMSFPYLLRFNSKLYMCPETSENRDIRLYECVKFPLDWKLSEILMSDVSAVDTMIFEHGGLWWLFTNIDPTETESHFAELFIFYSDNPIGTNWCAHPQNPFVIDSSKGRNAGILFDDNFIYRVSQKQGFNSYGKGFSINKILVLNKNEYVETGVCSVEPNFFPNLIGCHHLHSNGNISVFDYLQFTRKDR